MLEAGTKVVNHGIVYEVVQKVEGTKDRYVLKDSGPRGPYYHVVKEARLVKLDSPEGAAIKQITEKIVALEEQLEKLYAEERSLFPTTKRRKKTDGT